MTDKDRVLQILAAVRERSDVLAFKLETLVSRNQNPGFGGDSSMTPNQWANASLAAQALCAFNRLVTQFEMNAPPSRYDRNIVAKIAEDDIPF